MSSLVRDSPAGQLIRLVTGNKLLKYAEEKDNFKIPDTWLPTTKEAVEHGPRQDLAPLGPGDVESQSHLPPIPSQPSQACFVDDGTSTPSSQQQTKDHVILVDWYSPDDPDNPRNWSNLRRAWITTFLYLYTSVIYMSSAIYMPSEAGVEEEFGVSPTESALGLALFVLG